MQELEKHGGSHCIAPKEVARIVNRCGLLANGSLDVVDEYVHAWVEELEAFLSVPARITGPPFRVSISSEFGLADLPVGVYRELQEQSEMQRQFLLGSKQPAVKTPAKKEDRTASRPGERIVLL